MLDRKLDMCLRKTDAPVATKLKYEKSIQILHFDPVPPQGAWDINGVLAIHR